MPATIQVGTILMKNWPGTTQLLGLESEPCSGSWSVLKVLDSFALDHKIHAAGWIFFFIAAEVRVMFLGAVGAAKIESALQGLLRKVRAQHFNSLEITGIVAKHFLGVPYVTVSAHSRHMQESCQLDSTEARQRSQHNAERATG
ncbi:MAG: hypothetical protein WA741_16540 [Candidatus Sulfotelmatobacter sp.]